MHFLCDRHTFLGVGSSGNLVSHTGTAGSAIRILREELGLTLRELAERSGTSFAYLGQVERGEKVATDRWLRPVVRALADRIEERQGSAA